MRLDLFSGKNGLVVTLSRRNLLALLAKLDEPESYRAITSTNSYLDFVEIEGIPFVVHAESDADHYGQRRLPGPMTPTTEDGIRRS